MKRLALLCLLLVGAFQAAHGSARHLSDFALASQVAPSHQQDSAWWLLPGTPPNPVSVNLRTLKVETSCPIPGCDPSRCQGVDNGATPGYKCGGCQNALLLKNNACHCPAGRYGTYLTCADCPKGSYCPGGKYTEIGKPDKVECPVIEDPAGNIAMTTVGTRSTSKAKCVNPPGTHYIFNGADAEPDAARCAANTYGPGLKKQSACVPCPGGYTTDKVVDSVITPQTGQALRSACVVPEGYFSKAPGVIARCPPGEYKSGLGSVASCTKCLEHVTTEHDGAKSADDCTFVVPSYYATFEGSTISETTLCPYGHYCPGGDTAPARRRHLLAGDPDPQLKDCPPGTYTQDAGATSDAECLVPPGHYHDDGVMVQCPDNTYREEWRIPAAATLQHCLACGDGISAEPTEPVMLPSNLDDVESAPEVKLVRASAASCYIKPGQGMLKPFSGSYKGVWCDTNNYGVANTTFGLQAAPCTACPYNMVAEKPAALPKDFYSDADGTAGGDGGFTDPKACVTKVGFGYDGRISYKCPPGWYAAGGTRDACQQCPYGLTTRDVSTEQASFAHCGIAPGFGYHEGAIVPCPTGTYNGDAFRANTQTECTDCPDFTSTVQTGGLSKADCNVCKAGYGHDPNGPLNTLLNPADQPNQVLPNCLKECGTVGTFGPAGRNPGPGSECESCPAISPGFYFAWNSTVRLYQPAVVAPAQAESSGDCLAEFGQVGDVGAWYVGGAAPLEAVTMTEPATLEDCAAACKANASCEYITFDYKTDDITKKCFMKVNSLADKQYAAIGGEVMAYKAILAADTGAASVKSKALSSGRYTFYWESSTPIGTPSAASDTNLDEPWTFQTCLDACDADGDCLAAGMTKVEKKSNDTEQAAAVIGKCRLVKGVITAGVGKRSVTKVNLNLLSLPDGPGKGCTDQCNTGTCVTDADDWSTCECTGKYWDDVARDCVDYIPVLLDDRRFMIFRTKKTYKAAYDFCVLPAQDAMLATLKSQEETERLRAKAPNPGGSGPPHPIYWIGLANSPPPLTTWNPPALNKADWRWLSTGQPPEWDHWAVMPVAYPLEPEPNNWSNNEGQCAAVYAKANNEATRPEGYWSDHKCTTQFWFVCEK